MRRPNSRARRRVRKLRSAIGGGGQSRRYLEPKLRARRRRGALFLCLHIAAGLVYLIWLATALNLSAWYVTIPFFLAEVIALGATTLFAATIRHPRLHRPEGIRGSGRALTLDVWICTAGEPTSVVEPTVAAATRMAYGPKRVFLLDDADSPVIRSMARKYGVSYLSRSNPTDGKAGNLNHALQATIGNARELILTLDADQVPDRDLMQRLAGYFRFADVGLVASAQDFLLPPGDPFGNADSLFYRVMQTSKDADNAAFSCGSGVVYRRLALEQIGGFSTWNVVEDVHTSMRLHEAGWKSIYHPYPVATGTAPADILGYARQRRQWAIDSLRMFFWDNPFKHPRLTLPQKLQYLYSGAGYIFAGIVLPFYFAMPAWSMFSGQVLATTSAATYVIVRGVYMAFTFAAIGVLQRPIRGLKLFRMWAGAFPVYVHATIAALRSRKRKPEYQVNPKVHSLPSLPRRLGQVIPQLTIIAAIIVGVPLGWYWHELPLDALVMNTVWSVWVVWALHSIIYAAIQSEPPVEQQQSRARVPQQWVSAKERRSRQ